MIPRWRFILVFALLAGTTLFLHLHEDVAVPINRPFAELPRHHREWRMVSQSSFSTNVLKVLKPTDYIYRVYVNGDGVPVHIYVGYHSGGKESGGIHSPKHCMPGSGWYQAAEERVAVDLGGQSRVRLVKAVYQKGGDSELFLYWFQVKDRALSDEYSLKLYEIVNSMLYSRRESAFIRVSVPFNADRESAYAAGVAFIRDFYPLIMEFLPR
ncbi:MAG: exosortase C-terminal domain/associated protein EpsI [Nitrospirota bacterium]